MTLHDSIVSIKTRIKSLSAEQRQDKKSRKGCPAEKMSDLWGKVWNRSARITACLNLYHALRDSAFRHGIRDTYLDKRFTDELTKEFATETKA